MRAPANSSKYSGATLLRDPWNASQIAGAPQTIPLVDVRESTAETWTLLACMDWQIPNAGPESVVRLGDGSPASPSDLPVISLVFDEGGESFTVQDDTRTALAPLWRGFGAALHGKAPRAWGMFPGTGPGSTTVQGALKAWVVPRAPRLVTRTLPITTAVDWAAWYTVQTGTGGAYSSVIPWWAQRITITPSLTNNYLPVTPYLDFRDPTGTTAYGACTLTPNVRTTVEIPPEARFVYLRDPAGIGTGQAYATFEGVQ